MPFNKDRIKKILGASFIIVGVIFFFVSFIAKIKRGNSVYDNQPENKNPMEGKRVVFICDEDDEENADGIKGHLKAVGDSVYHAGIYDKYVKRAFDMVISFFGLLLLSPFLVGIAIAIKIDDPGPVLFTQKRLGQNKKYFKLHKFRSMKMSTPHDVPTHMLKNPEQYITKVGKFLRAHSLDELPQIWDIFIGNMSIIGPRPGLWNQDVLTAERDKYGANDVKPGLTGWAQINGRDELEIFVKARMDGEYVQRESLLFDIRCFFGTIGKIAKDDSVVEGGTGVTRKEKSKVARNYTEGKTDEDLIGEIGFGEKVIVNYNIQKKVLITGKGSYIGESFKTYAEKHYKDNFVIDELDMMDPEWRKVDFSKYDIVYHVAGIAHADVENVSEETKENYYAVNTDLAIKVAEKAKKDGVKEFIFMSSMIVYGESAPYGKKKIIDKNTVPVPVNFYGDSKLQADVGVRELADDRFKVIVLRPPMIYGKGSKGNYPILAKLAKRLPIFPDVVNERSMLYIDNFCEFLCQIMLVQQIKMNAVVLIPQNKEWIRTSQMVKAIAKLWGNNIHELKALIYCVTIVCKIPGKIGELANKAFGNYCYAHEMSDYAGIEYQNVSLLESVINTEKEGQDLGETKCRNTNRAKALMLASVASMIDLFNDDNINILQHLGYQVDVAANFEFGSITSQKRVDEYKNELLERRIDVYHIPIPRELSKVRDIFISYKKIKKMVNTKNYRLIHCHSPIGSVVCRLACREARKKYGSKVIYTAHGFHFFRGAGIKAWLIFYPIEYICSFFTDILITINHEDYKRARRMRAKEVKYIPGIGIHTNEFCNVSIDRNKKREELGIEKDDFIFMSTGQISKRKNQEVIIRALALIKNPKVKYLLVGFGELEVRLKKLAVELGVNDRVIFAGYRSDVKELLYIADAYVFPSIQEGLPASLMEAMAVGLPVVCSRIRGNIDLIEDGKGGYLYDCYDIDGFALGMRKIIEGVNNKMGITNIENMKKFDISVVNRLMEKIYEEV